MKINDNITYIHTVGDRIYLKSKLLPVNMRLFESSAGYRMVIRACCKHIAEMCMIKMEDYKLPHGMSGANCAIPFNIIAYAIGRGSDLSLPMIMINPKIVGSDGAKKPFTSNCGSIRLAEPIQVYRYPKVQVDFYNTSGDHVIEWFTKYAGTIQHEIDHNNGILITDYEPVAAHGSF